MIRMQLFGAAVVSAIAAMMVDSASAVNLDTEEMTPGQRQGLANVLSMAQNMRNEIQAGRTGRQPNEFMQANGAGASITQPFA